MISACCTSAQDVRWFASVGSEQYAQPMDSGVFHFLLWNNDLPAGPSWLMAPACLPQVSGVSGYTWRQGSWQVLCLQAPGGKHFHGL
jgi:hypothetical protein